MICILNLKYLKLNGIFVRPEKYRNRNMETENTEEMTVAYAAPETPNFKLNMKIGSKAKFKRFEIIIMMVGLLESPSD
jgi:hypothetical protein